MSPAFWVVIALLVLPLPARAAGFEAAVTSSATPTTSPSQVTAPPAPPVPVLNFGGRLIERGTRRPLSEAQVVIAELGLTAISDAEGNFEFEDVEPGVYTVIVPIVGYLKFQTREEIAPGERTQVLYYVEPAPGNLEIIVEAERVRKEVSRVTLRREEITKVPGTNNDALRVVQTLPGVTAVNELSGELLVRGSGPFDNLIQIDRLQVPFAYHFGGLKSVFSSEMISRIDFYPGGFSSKYGNAMGGVVDAETRQGNAERYSGFLDVNVLLSEGLIEGPIGKKARFAVSGRRSYLDFLAGPLTKAIAPPGQYQFTVFPQFYDYQIRVDYEPHDKHRLTVLTFGADDVARLFADVENDREPGIRGDFFLHNQFHNQALIWWWKPNRRTRLRTMGAHYLVPQEARVGQNDYVNITTTVPTFFHDGEWDHGDNTLRFGYNMAQLRTRLDTRFPRLPQRGETDYSFTDAPRVNVSRTSFYTRHGAYLEDILQPAKSFKLIPGINVGALQEKSNPYADGRLAARYSPVTHTTLKGAVGTYHGYPGPFLMDDDFGNPELKPQRAIHYIAGVEQQFAGGWEASLEGYYKDFVDLVASYAGAAQRFSNEGSGYSYGMEVYLRKNLTERLFGWITYSYSKSRRIIPPDRVFSNFQFDQPHVANVIASYKVSRAWQLGARWHFASGNPYTPVEGSVFLIDKGFYLPQFSADLYSKRLPPTHRLDFRVDRTWTYDEWRLLLYAEVWNVYMHPNLLGFNFNYDYTKRVDVHSFPILPSVGVRGEF